MKEVVLINHIVAQPTSLGADHTLALSYIATPFKPMVKGWRMTQSTEDGTFHQPFRNVRTDSKTGLKVFQNPGGGLLHVNWIHPESRYPEEWEDLWHQQRTEGFAGWPAADSVAHAMQWRDPYAARKSGFTHMSFQVYGYGRKTRRSPVLLLWLRVGSRRERRHLARHLYRLRHVPV